MTEQAAECEHGKLLTHTVWCSECHTNIRFIDLAKGARRLEGALTLLSALGVADDPLARGSVDDVHGWFGLTYASYLTVPRAVLQAMPADWQARFVALMNEVDDTFDWMTPDCHYEVKLRHDPTGQYFHDGLSNYRYPPEIATRHSRESHTL